MTGIAVEGAGDTRHDGKGIHTGPGAVFTAAGAVERPDTEGILVNARFGSEGVAGAGGGTVTVGGIGSTVGAGGIEIDDIGLGARNGGPRDGSGGADGRDGATIRRS